ncbi:MAG: hypothetical protein AAF203_00650 [Pseudomonadota bacterium]
MRRRENFLIPFTTLIFLSAILLSCKNPLGGQDSRDSEFSPGGGSSGGGSGSSDSTPPSAPSNLSLDARWVTGAAPVTSPVFSWTNPIDEDFSQAQVALGITIGGEELTPFTSSSTANSHSFTGLSLIECSQLYYASVQASDNSGNTSTVVSDLIGFRYDNTTPTAPASLSIPGFDGSSSSTVTVDWTATPGSDNCGNFHYEIALGYDDDSDGFDTGDQNNVIDWTDIPGGSATTSYQIQNGVDGFSFSAVFNRQYVTSIRAIDDAELSSTVTSSSPWATFSPDHLSGLALWFDGSDASTHFQDSGCAATPATTLSDPIGCWRDKSGGNHHAVQAGATTPSLGATGIVFDGDDDILTIGSKIYAANSDLTLFLLVETDTQSNNGSSCCRPILSWVSNSGGLFPWLGLTRGNLGPNNNLFHGWNGSGLSYIPTNPGDQIVVSATHDGSNSFWNAYSFGLQRVTNQAIPGSYSGTTNVNLGGDTSNVARRFGGEIYEVIVYESILNNSERQNVEGYLACKYGTRDQLDASHPYYNLVGTSVSGCP